MDQTKSNQQYDTVIATCKQEFIEKSKKYGNSLTAYDAFGVLSKIFIKIYRIASIQKAGTYLVDGEPIEKEFPGVINYCLYGLIVIAQLTNKDYKIPEGDALFKAYEGSVKTTRDLFQKKNHDYGEAWRQLSISYMTQECVAKYLRLTKIYTDLKFNTDQQELLQKEYTEVVSDICNYSIFCAIRINEGVDPMI